MTDKAFRKATLDRDSASTLASGLQRYLAAEFGRNMSHTKAMGTLAIIGGYVNVHEMTASYIVRDARAQPVAPVEPAAPTAKADPDPLEEILRAGQDGVLSPVLTAYLIDRPNRIPAFSLECWCLVGRILAAGDLHASAAALRAALGDAIAEEILRYENDRRYRQFSAECRALVDDIRKDRCEDNPFAPLPSAKPLYWLLHSDRIIALIGAVGSQRAAVAVHETYATIYKSDKGLDPRARFALDMIRAKARRYGWTLPEAPPVNVEAKGPTTLDAFLDKALGTEPGGNLIVALDVSGGMPRSAVERITRRLQEVIERRAMTSTSIMFDGVVQETGRSVSEFLDRPIPGGGATLIGPVEKAVPDLLVGHDVLLVVTDGWLDRAGRFPIPTAYAIIEESDLKPNYFVFRREATLPI